jgi:hypothetical protein
MIWLLVPKRPLYQQQLCSNSLFFNKSTHIYSNKVLHVLQKICLKFQLRKVDADVTVAIEYCFAFQYNSTQYTNTETKMYGNHLMLHTCVNSSPLIHYVKR